MKISIVFISTLFLSVFLFGQASSVLDEDVSTYEYLPSSEHPFGQANPEAPEQIKDYEMLIGKCNCKSEARKQDGIWNEAIDMVWVFKYIMNGMGVQDETFKSDGTHSGSIRQFDKETKRWIVHYYSSNATPTTLSSWLGGKKGDNMVLYKEQKAPNGMDGSYRLTFSDISEDGFKWIGEWVSPDESIVYPTWKIDCKKNK